MRARTTALILISLLCGWGCSNLENASASKRNTFLRLYEGPLSITATDLLVESDGFIVLGNMTNDEGITTTVALKTDLEGNQVDDFHYYEGGTGLSIIPFSNNAFTGYLVIGDSIHIDPNAGQVGNIEILSARILALNENLEMLNSKTFSDNSANVIKTDISGVALTSRGDGGIIGLLTFRVADATLKPWVISLNNNLTLDWEYRFEALEKDYVNGKSIHYYNNSTIWASSLLRQQGSFNEKYLAINRVEDYLSPLNYSLLGESLNKTIAANDLQPAQNINSGFGVVGTFSETDGSKKNMFFTRVRNNGSLSAPPDTVFIDAVAGETTSTVSKIDETGVTLCNTSDGGFILAGTMTTSPVDGITVGNGGSDLFLVKIDAFRRIVWTKIIGGTGNETVAAIKETPDKGILVCGSNDLGNYSSMYLLKLDSEGNLRD